MTDQATTPCPKSVLNALEHIRSRLPETLDEKTTLALFHLGVNATDQANNYDALKAERDTLKETCDAISLSRGDWKARAEAAEAEVERLKEDIESVTREGNEAQREWEDYRKDAETEITDLKAELRGY